MLFLSLVTVLGQAMADANPLCGGGECPAGWMNVEGDCVMFMSGWEEDSARQVCRGLKAEFSEFFISRSDSESATRHSLPVCLLRRETQSQGFSGPVIQNNQISTIDIWGPQYKVEVDIIVNSFTSGNEYGYSNILRFTSSDSDCCNLGDRIPLIFYNRNGFLTITSSVNGNGNDYFDYDIDLEKWYHIEIYQAERNGQYYYTIKIDGTEEVNVVNSRPLAFQDVKVFAGDNFFPAADADYKNLIWETN